MKVFFVRREEGVEVENNGMPSPRASSPFFTMPVSLPLVPLSLSLRLFFPYHVGCKGERLEVSRSVAGAPRGSQEHGAREHGAPQVRFFLLSFGGASRV